MINLLSLLMIALSLTDTIFALRMQAGDLSLPQKYTLILNHFDGLL